MSTNALANKKAIEGMLQGKSLAAFLDYDGTLAPIAPHPDQAKMSDEMRQTLHRLASKCQLAIISGRSRQDVERHVQLKDIYYAGSHGFDIAGPGGCHFEVTEGKEKQHLLEQAAKEIEEKLAAIEGAWIERKPYAVAVHFRQAKLEKEKEIEQIVKSAQQKFPSALRTRQGKKNFEVLPAIPWHKGKAVEKLLSFLKVDVARTLPLYIGDDTTDEDAFQTLAGYGLTIAVQEQEAPTLATFSLKNPEEVRLFLDFLESVYKAS